MAGILGWLPPAAGGFGQGHQACHWNRTRDRCRTRPRWRPKRQRRPISETSRGLRRAGRPERFPPSPDRGSLRGGSMQRGHSVTCQNRRAPDSAPPCYRSGVRRKPAPGASPAAGQASLPPQPVTHPSITPKTDRQAPPALVTLPVRNERQNERGRPGQTGKCSAGPRNAPTPGTTPSAGCSAATSGAR
jgi:hypothetical protein